MQTEIIVVLDTEEYELLLDISQEELRTPSNQLLFMFREGLRARNPIRKDAQRLLPETRSSSSKKRRLPNKKSVSNNFDEISQVTESLQSYNKPISKSPLDPR